MSERTSGRDDKHSNRVAEEDDAENDETLEARRQGQVPDIGLGNNSSNAGNLSTARNPSRREECHVSFKQFLNMQPPRPSGSTVFPDLYSGTQNILSSPSPEELSGSSLTVDRTTLPDFVQDHLVIEKQINHSNDRSSHINNANCSVTNSAQSSNISRNVHLTHSPSVISNHRSNRTVPPLDLPSGQSGPSSQGLPFDLTHQSVEISSQMLAEQQHGASFTLPDFLSDSRVCSRTTSARHSQNTFVTSSSNDTSQTRQIETLQVENDALKRQLDALHGIIAQQMSRAELAESRAAALKRENDHLQASSSNTGSENRAQADEPKNQKSGGGETSSSRQSASQPNICDFVQHYTVALQSEIGEIRQLITTLLARVSQLESVSEHLKHLVEDRKEAE